MSFFDTEEDEVPILGAGSAGESKFTATAQFGAKKDIHIPRHYNVTENKCSSLFYGVKAIIDKTI